MANQLNHKYELLFGQPVSFYSRTTEQPNFSSQTPLTSNGLLQTLDPQVVPIITDTKDAKGLRLTEHQITFQVVKSKESGKQTTITVYNISDRVRQYLEMKAGTAPAIVLYGGYETDNDLPLLFQGEVHKVKDSFNGHTRITEILCKTGYRNLAEAYTVKSFRGGVKLSTVITGVLQDLRMPVGTMYIPKELDIIIDKPTAISSVTRDWLDKTTKGLGLKMFVEDGTVNILPDNFVERDGKFVFEISSENSNLIGSPSLVDDNSGTPEKASTTKESIKVTTPLNGSYQIGNMVSLKSRYYTGIYEIEAITHNGDYEGGNWMSELQLKPTNQWEISP